MMSSERFKRLTEVWRQQGAMGLARWISYRAAKRLVNIRAARVLCLDRQTAAGDCPDFRVNENGTVPFGARTDSVDTEIRTGPADKDFVFRFLAPDDVRRWTADPANDLSAAMGARLDAGRDFCFAALTAHRTLDAGRLAGYAWFALRWIEPEHSADAGISFADDVAYLYKGYVRADFRGRRLYNAIIRRGLDAMAERGVRRLLCLVEWTNQAALRSCLHGGWTDLGRLVTFGYGRRRAVFGPRAAGEQGITFGCRAPASVLYSPLSQRNPNLESRI